MNLTGIVTKFEKELPTHYARFVLKTLGGEYFCRTNQDSSCELKNGDSVSVNGLVHYRHSDVIIVEEINVLNPKNTALRYKLVQVGNMVVFQVLEMDERFRGNKGNLKEYNPSERGLLKVHSCGEPEFYSDRIYLHGGVLKKDKNTVHHRSSYSASAQDYFDKVQASLLDWANNCKEFHEEVERDDKIRIIIADKDGIILDSPITSFKLSIEPPKPFNYSLGGMRWDSPNTNGNGTFKVVGTFQREPKKVKYELIEEGDNTFSIKEV